MMSVIRIHRYEYPEENECLLLWRYTLSSYHWHLVEIIFHRSDGTAWIYALTRFGTMGTTSPELSRKEQRGSTMSQSTRPKGMGQEVYN
jgi:hypothetical protein